MNKGIAWSCLSGFTLTQIPGVLAHMHNLYYGDSLVTKPKWMRDLLAARKHLGLVSLWMLGVHILMTCLIFGPNYYGPLFLDPKDALSKMKLNGELAYMCGSFGAALYVILGICSLPSVAEQMTNRQWAFVYGPVAWAALFFGTFHVISQGGKCHCHCLIVFFGNKSATHMSSYRSNSRRLMESQGNVAWRHASHFYHVDRLAHARHDVKDHSSALVPDGNQEDVHISQDGPRQ
jgi:hypothetical protein